MPGGRWKIRVEEFGPLGGRQWSSKKTVGAHRRRTKGKTYISPRVVLNSELNHLIGRKYDVYVAKVKVLPDVKEEERAFDRIEPSDAVILVFS